MFYVRYRNSIRKLCTKTKEISKNTSSIGTKKGSLRSHKAQMTKFIKDTSKLNEISSWIPSKCLELKRKGLCENLYLIDENVAKETAALIIPHLKTNPNQIIAETNAGIGLIATELLKNNIKLVRLYESSLDFRLYLKDMHEQYPGRIELFTKDIFLLHRYNFMDTQDRGNRVEQLLKGIPKKNWTDDPAITIIGPLSNTTILRFLIKQLVLQNRLVFSGRYQFYVFMRPADYLILTAGPHRDLHTYQRWSVLANLFLEFEILSQFPRKVFLPWERKKVRKKCRYVTTVDPDMMYLVRINFKKNLPVENEYLLHLFLFVLNYYRKGTPKVVPTVEKAIPGSGLNILMPTLNHMDYFKNMSIFTTFGELTPNQILCVFKELILHPTYSVSPFMAMVESQLVKTETIETDLDDEHLEKNFIDDFEVKLD